ncbi:efflux RND transporter periplasmic adaptor subunit [Pseudochryseolinea flava]|uniref:Efflux RND transporter periplasmic adaptor subunit n=1 Tax=Pseudochryseolinea flava TaxID=2059302 RepID=A0A364XVK2_9BACT|nr:efflux RND transporter periplasmic adaptor subunit [Pseudochryseolinea flava]RAV97744.1 efflux RND transporter periplasmic adaptor subunit [Pseudochryseolinea flava]
MNRVLVTIVLIASISCGNREEVVTPKTKPLIEAVYASGIVSSQDEYEIFSQVDGYLREKLVADGDDVKTGDVLFIIDSDQQSARFKIAQDNYNLARKNAAADSPLLTELSAAVASVKSKLQFDSVNFVRYSNLWKENATTKVDYERFKLQYENAKNEFLLQQSRLKKVKDQVTTELQNMQAQLQIAADESGRYIVKSDVDGTLFHTTKDKGELVRRGELIAIAGDNNSFYLKLNVDELDIQRVKVGQQVKTKIDAYPDKVFTATVKKVYPMVNQLQQSIRVDAVLNEKLPAGFSGLAVEANIIVREKNSALVIPNTALLPGDSVWMEIDGEKKKVKVTTGIKTLDEVEILK